MGNGESGRAAASAQQRPAGRMPQLPATDEPLSRHQRFPPPVKAGTVDFRFAIPDSLPSWMRADQATAAQSGLDPAIELFGLGAAGDGPGEDAGQGALVGVDRLGKRIE